MLLRAFLFFIKSTSTPRTNLKSALNLTQKTDLEIGPGVLAPSLPPRAPPLENLNPQLRKKLRMRWFFDVSKVKESSFFKSDLTDLTLDAHLFENINFSFSKLNALKKFHFDKEMRKKGQCQIELWCSQS